MTVKEFMKKMGISIGVTKPEPRLAEGYYKVRVKRRLKGYKDEQEVEVNDPTAMGYTMTLSHPKTTKSIVLPHFMPPKDPAVQTGEEFMEFHVSAANGGFPSIQPVKSNLLVIRHWLGEERYEELIGCEV